MKRITSACIVQTIHFKSKDGEMSECAKRSIRDEVKKYKEGLEKRRTKYKIISEKEEYDGSVIMEIKKQYNTSPVGNYLN